MSRQNKRARDLIPNRALFLVLETLACKPDSVTFCNADDHFSAAKIAPGVTFSVSRKRSNQPGNSAGRVIVSCLVLHRTEVAKPPRHRDAGALLL